MDGREAQDEVLDAPRVTVGDGTVSCALYDAEIGPVVAVGVVAGCGPAHLLAHELEGPRVS